jgi:hypothetical protein
MIRIVGRALRELGIALWPWLLIWAGVSTVFTLTYYGLMRVLPYERFVDRHATAYPLGLVAVALSVLVGLSIYKEYRKSKGEEW